MWSYRLRSRGARSPSPRHRHSGGKGQRSRFPVQSPFRSKKRSRESAEGNPVPCDPSTVRWGDGGAARPCSPSLPSMTSHVAYHPPPLELAFDEATCVALLRRTQADQPTLRRPGRDAHAPLAAAPSSLEGDDDAAAVGSWEDAPSNSEEQNRRRKLPVARRGNRGDSSDGGCEPSSSEPSDDATQGIYGRRRRGSGACHESVSAAAVTDRASTRVTGSRHWRSDSVVAVTTMFLAQEISGTAPFHVQQYFDELADHELWRRDRRSTKGYAPTQAGVTAAMHNGPAALAAALRGTRLT